MYTFTVNSMLSSKIYAIRTNILYIHVSPFIYVMQKENIVSELTSKDTADYPLNITATTTTSTTNKQVFNMYTCDIGNIYILTHILCTHHTHIIHIIYAYTYIHHKH